MAGKIKVKVKGVREEVEKLRSVPGIVFAEVLDQAEGVHKDWIGESQDRTPLLTGALTRSQHPMDVNSLSRIVVQGPKIRLIVGSKLDYAEKMHEDHYRLGKLSEVKMRRTGKLVGRKFIERALKENRARYERQFSEAKDRGIEKAGYGGNR
jgi:hypothetical protein